MKIRVIAMALFLAMAAIPVSAQLEVKPGDRNTVRGTVIDKKNRPLEGVQIEVENYEGTVITGSDGSFVIPDPGNGNKARFSIPGYRTEKNVVVSNGMTLKLNKIRYPAPDKTSMFVAAQWVQPNWTKSPGFGLMLGMVKTCGWYVKFGLNSFNFKNDHIEFNPEDAATYPTGKCKHKFWTVGAGFIVRLKCPLHLYIGGSAGQVRSGFELRDGSFTNEVESSYRYMYRYSTWTMESSDIGTVDFGLMWRINKHILVTGGIQFLVGNITDSFGPDFMTNLGIGYAF